MKNTRNTKKTSDNSIQPAHAGNQSSQAVLQHEANLPQFAQILPSKEVTARSVPRSSATRLLTHLGTWVGADLQIRLNEIRSNRTNSIGQ